MRRLRGIRQATRIAPDYGYGPQDIRGNRNMVALIDQGLREHHSDEGFALAQLH